MYVDIRQAKSLNQSDKTSTDQKSYIYSKKISTLTTVSVLIFHDFLSGADTMNNFYNRYCGIRNHVKTDIETVMHF